MMATGTATPGRTVRVLVGAYRPWAKTLLGNVEAHAASRGLQLQSVRYSDQRQMNSIVRHPAVANFEIALFLGWSWIVPPEIYEAIPCVCLHPSRLPDYAGGSPLQHQIIDGVRDSAITLFKMTEGIDAGPIYAQRGLSLEGSLDDIFARIVRDATPMLVDVIDSIAHGAAAAYPQHVPQGEHFAARRRRTPEQSEIVRAMFQTESAAGLHNFVRALAHPEYPNAFVTCGDGRRLYITGTHLDPPTQPDAREVNSQTLYGAWAPTPDEDPLPLVTPDEEGQMHPIETRKP